MTQGSPATERSAQLPQGRYPASAATIWSVTTLTLLIGLTLAVLIPAALSSNGAGDRTPESSLDVGRRDGGNP